MVPKLKGVEVNRCDRDFLPKKPALELETADV